MNHSRLADAHMHLFARGGFCGERSISQRPGVRIDERRLYESFALEHGISDALVVGYEAESFAIGNNRHIAKLSAEARWMHPLAYLCASDLSDPKRIFALTQDPFVGVSVYAFSDEMELAIAHTPAEVWKYLEAEQLLISVNSSGGRWNVWRRILTRHAQLKLLVSHLGLPPKLRRAPTVDRAVENMKPIIRLSEFPGVHIKLSGLYDLTAMGHDFPHSIVKHYVDAAEESFGASRILWGSDFSPCLGCLSFPQAVRSTDLLSHAAARLACGPNLFRLLKGVRKNRRNMKESIYE